MRKKKIFILLGHPDNGALLGSFADAYERGARSGGHEVRRLNLGELSFDPILHRGYKEVQELEPDLLKIQQNIKWCDHLAIFYPTWWSTMPALLKGMFDRMWLPGFAFSFRESGFGWQKLLKGRSARAVVSYNMPPLLARLLLGDTTNEIRRGILRFAGFRPVKVTKIGRMENISDSRRENWKRRLACLGQCGE